MSDPALKRLPWLDSLRFGAFFVVFIAHVTYFLNFPVPVTIPGSVSRAILQNGDLGVGLFFVLSGFLITYILEREYVSRGTISLKRFYVRRVLRIWPLYFFALLLIVGASFLAAHTHAIFKVGIVPVEFTAHALFSGNIYRAFWNTANEMVSVLWSVGVEEQFYLFWPLLFLFFRKREKLNWVIITGIIASMGARWVYHDNFDARQFFTLSVVSDLFIGAWMGLYANRVAEWARGEWARVSVLVGVLAVASVVLVRGLVFYGSIPPWFESGGRIITAISFGTFIAFSAFGLREPRSRAGQIFERVTSWLGERSYGLYVLHMVGLTLAISILGTLAQAGVGVFTVTALLAFMLTVAISALSFRFLEQPFLKLKARFTS